MHFPAHAHPLSALSQSAATVPAIAIAITIVASAALASPAFKANASTAGPILSEAMADPTFTGDAQGEFLELGNPGADTLRLDSLRIDVDAQSLILTGWMLEPGGLFLICRDSLPGENGGMACS